MRVIIVQISLLLISISLFFIEMVPFGVIMLSLTLVLIVYTVLFNDDCNCIHFISPFKLKRVHSKYGMFYVGYINNTKGADVVLIRDVGITYHSIKTMFFKTIDDLKIEIEYTLYKKYGDDLQNARNIIKNWDGYTNTVEKRNGKITKIIK